jgi:hypothetical protein
MSTTIAGNHTVAITLNPSTPDIVVTGTIDATAHLTNYTFHYGSSVTTIHVSGALYAPKTGAFYIQNDGLIETSTSVTSTGSVNAGVVLRAADAFVNAGAGTVMGRTGILMLGPAGSYVKNQGVIDASYIGIEVLGRGLVVNTGIIKGSGSFGIVATGGTIVNSGQIYGDIVLENDASGKGAHAPSHLTTVDNSGFVDGAIVDLDGKIVNSGFAKELGMLNGVMINSGIVRSTGSVAVSSNNAAFYNYGQVIAQGTGVTGEGHIYNYGHIVGGTGVNVSSSSVSTYLYNAGNGHIDGTASAGIVFQSFGAIVNKGAVSGATYGLDVIGAGGNTASVVNTGKIKGIGPASDGIRMRAYGTIVNAGSVVGGGAGILLYGGGTITNTGNIAGATGIEDEAGGQRVSTIINKGLISATGAGSAAVALALGDTLSNAGTISATGTGVDLNAGGTVIDKGAIKAGMDGIYVSAGGNIYISGKLEGGSYALKFNPDFEDTTANDLTLAPGAVLTGAVNGGGGMLTLAGGGNKTGVIGAGVTNFAAIIVDANARWDIPAQAANGLVENNGILVAAGATQTIGTLQGAGTIALGGGNLVLPGYVQSTQTIAFAATTETLAIGSASAFGATLTEFATGDVINLTNLAFSNVTSLGFTAGTLSIYESGTALTIAFGNPSFAGESFVAFQDIDGTGIRLQGSGAMTFLTPASASAGTALPCPSHVYAAADHANPIAAAATPSLSGWLSTDWMTKIQTAAIPVTLHA